MPWDDGELQEEGDEGHGQQPPSDLQEIRAAVLLAAESAAVPPPQARPPPPPAVATRSRRVGRWAFGWRSVSLMVIYIHTLLNAPHFIISNHINNRRRGRRRLASMEGRRAHRSSTSSTSSSIQSQDPVRRMQHGVC
jgi:hypothetical protein